MAQFAIYLDSPRGIFNLTNYDSVTGQLLGNTFDEQIKLGVDDSSFTFSMLKYRYQESKKIVNELALRVVHGSMIRVQTQGREFMFVVHNITYTFLSDNLQLTFSCQDAFQAFASRIGIGYTITNDANDDYYIGAQSIDDWAEQIVRENNLDWSYIRLDSANSDLINRLASAAAIETRDNLDQLAEWHLLDDEYQESLKSNPATLNVTVSFSCRDSNAYEALKTLAGQNELIIQSDYSRRCFWFVPRKSLLFKGYYVRPTVNLASIGVEGRGENLSTVLDVVGSTDIDDNEITLVPSLPPKVRAFITDPKWLKSTYYPRLYLDLYQENDPALAQDITALRQIAAVPWLENKLINIDYFKERSLLTYEVADIEHILNDKLRIVNGCLMVAARGFLKKKEELMQQFNKLESEGEAVLGHIVSDIQYVYDQMFDPSRLRSIQQGATNVKWPLILSLYEDQQGIQYYCGPKFINSNLKIIGENLDGSTFDPVPAQAAAPLYCVGSFSVEAAKNVRWVQLQLNNVPVSNPLYFALANSVSPTTTVTTLNSFVEAVHFRQKILNLSESQQFVLDLDAFLQERAAGQEALYQLLLENTYKFQHELTNLNFLQKMRKVGIVTNDEGIIQDVDYVTTADRINMLSEDTFTPEELVYLHNYFHPTEKASHTATRREIIETYTSIDGSLTQYWQVMRSCGLKLGLFFPETWDCLDILALLNDPTVDAATNPFLTVYKPLLPLSYNQSTLQYSLADIYAPRNIQSVTGHPYRLKFYDQQKELLWPLRTRTSVNNRSTTNTDTNYDLVTDLGSNPLKSSPYFYAYYKHRQDENVDDLLQLYAMQSAVPTTIYQITDDYGKIPYYNDATDIEATIICGVRGYGQQDNTGWPIDDVADTRYSFNQIMALPYWLATRGVDSTEYYTWQVEHNKIWQELYGKYPGIFRETVYNDTTSKNSTELYNAAKAQLQQVSQPEFTYSMSALDIYMYDQDLLPYKIQLGDQIRIDYQEDASRFDMVNKALRESLFVTGITHTLRTDGDYQFTVETRRATDIMVQRFARLLSNGR